MLYMSGLFFCRRKIIPLISNIPVVITRMWYPVDFGIRCFHFFQTLNPSAKLIDKSSMVDFSLSICPVFFPENTSNIKTKSNNKNEKYLFALFFLLFDFIMVLFYRGFYGVFHLFNV